jgi:hypothetical protein
MPCRRPVRSSQVKPVVLRFGTSQAWITGADGQPARAARLLGAAHTVWRSTGTSLSGPGYLAPSHHEHCEQRSRTALGDEQFTAAFQHGTRFTPEQAIDHALKTTSQPTTTVQPAPAPTDPSL